MKKTIGIFMILFFVILCGCQNTKNGEDTTRIDIDMEANTEDELEISTAIIENLPDETPYMFMLEGKLYVDTGETESRVTCGTMDRGFEKVISADEIPNKDGEVNFKCEYQGAQSWQQENRYVAWADNAWHIFAYNENNLDGITMEVIDATKHGVRIKVSNNGKKRIIFGDDFTIQKLDESINEWRRVEELCEYAYHDIAYEVMPGNTTEKEIEFEWLYGILEPGTYRIVKKIMDFRDTGDYTDYWYLAEFMVD